MSFVYCWETKELQSQDSPDGCLLHLWVCSEFTQQSQIKPSFMHKKMTLHFVSVLFPVRENNLDSFYNKSISVGNAENGRR